MQFSEILNYVLGGGLVALLVAVGTLRATVRKANADAERAKAEAEKAKADAETVRIDNAEHATRILIENIVEPLKEELTAVRNELGSTRKDLCATKREMARLRKALDAANSCKHHNDCPVLFRLREFPKGAKDDNTGVGGDTSPPPDTAAD